MLGNAPRPELVRRRAGHCLCFHTSAPLPLACSDKWTRGYSGRAAPHDHVRDRASSEHPPAGPHQGYYPSRRQAIRVQTGAPETGVRFPGGLRHCAATCRNSHGLDSSTHDVVPSEGTHGRGSISMGSRMGAGTGGCSPAAPPAAQSRATYSCRLMGRVSSTPELSATAGEWERGSRTWTYAHSLPQCARTECIQTCFRQGSDGSGDPVQRILHLTNGIDHRLQSRPHHHVRVLTADGVARAGRGAGWWVLHSHEPKVREQDNVSSTEAAR